MTRNWRIILPLVAFFVVSVGAQERPDFTGTWKADTGSSRDRNIDKVTQQGSELQITRSISSGSGPLGGFYTTHYTYHFDGAEEYKQNGLSASWTTANWQGSALVLLTVSREGSRVTVRREAWTLSDDGKTLTEARRIIRPDRVTEAKLVFHRQ